jgi:hypothetical protein
MKHGLEVERQIVRAIEEGKFADLAGAGKPLNLDQNAFEDPTRRMAFHVMKLGAVVPDWVQLGNEIESAGDAIQVDIERHERNMRGARDRILNDPVMDMRHRLGALYRKHRSSRTEIRARLIQLRRKIERFNWIAPDSAGRVAIQVEPEMRAVDRAWPWPPPRQ